MKIINETNHTMISQKLLFNGLPTDIIWGGVRCVYCQAVEKESNIGKDPMRNNEIMREESVVVMGYVRRDRVIGSLVNNGIHGIGDLVQKSMFLCIGKNTSEARFRLLKGLSHNQDEWQEDKGCGYVW